MELFDGVTDPPQRVHARVRGPIPDQKPARRPAGRYDAVGLTLPGVLLVVASALVGIFVLIARFNAAAAGRDAGDVLYYGGLSVMFGYIPYLTGYASFRMATLASGTRVVFRIAAATLGLSLAIGLAFAAVGRFPEVIMLVLVFGIPSLAGVVACLAQMAVPFAAGAAD